MASMVVKTFILLFLIFTCPTSGGADSLKEGLKLANPCGQVIVQRKAMRKLLEAETFLDYQQPGPNKRHAPPMSGNPGGGASTNP